jgi:hypothetical protein
MGTLRVRCSKCETPFRAPDAAAGKRVKCPHCQAPVLIPAAQEEEAPVRPPVKKPQPKPALRDDRPRHPPVGARRRKPPQNYVGMIVTLVILVALGIGGYKGIMYALSLLKEKQTSAAPTAADSGQTQPSTPTVPVAAGAVAWVPDASQAGMLGEDTTLKGYHYRPPKSFKSTKVTPEVGVGQLWAGTSNPGDAETSLAVSVVACEESDDPEKSLDAYLGAAFGKAQRFKKEKVERGTIGGEAFIRVQWTSEDAQHKALRGVSYLIYHGTDLCGLSAYEPTEKRASDLKLAEAAILTFQKK